MEKSGKGSVIKRVENQFQLIFKLLSIFSMTGVVPNQHKTGRKKRFELFHMLVISIVLWGHSGILFYKLIIYYIIGKRTKDIVMLEEKFGNGSIAVYVIIMAYTLRSALTVLVFGFLGRAKQMQVHLITIYEGLDRVVSKTIKDALFHRQAVMCYAWFPCILIAGWSIFLACVFDFKEIVGQDKFALFLASSFVGITYLIGICVCSTIYFCFMCSLTRDRFEEIAHEFETLKPQEVEIKLCCLIGRHHTLCEIMWQMDRFLSIYTFINYLLLIPEFCAILYQMTIFRNLRFMLICTGCFEAINLTAISLSAANVEESVRASTTAVAKLAGMTQVSPLRKMQAVLFLEKLNGPEIGFTCWDFFVITRQTLLKIYGAVITYFLLLMQFRQTRY